MFILALIVAQVSFGGREDFMSFLPNFYFITNFKEAIKMQIINLTPHNINIIGENGKVVQTFPASGELARRI